jgi:hypothetical protein
MIDNPRKFLAESYSSDFASWLLGKPITLTKIEQSELAVEPIRADTLCSLISNQHPRRHLKTSCSAKLIIMRSQFIGGSKKGLAFAIAIFYSPLPIAKNADQ